MSDYLTQGMAERQAWSGYWWPMMSNRDRPDYRNLYDANGPLDKYDRYCSALGLPNPRSRDFENWRNFADARLENATGYKAFWWGHCNGWCAASALFREPKEDAKVNGIVFTSADIKALLVKLNAESKALADSVAKNVSDEQLKKDLTALHDRFHEIIGACRDEKKKHQ